MESDGQYPIVNDKQNRIISDYPFDKSFSKRFWFGEANIAKANDYNIKYCNRRYFESLKTFLKFSVLKKVLEQFERARENFACKVVST